MKTQPRSPMTLLLCGLAVSALFVACAGDAGESDEGQGGSSSSSSGNSSSGSSSSGSVEYSCCINGVGYACPSNAAVNQCIGFDIDGCINGCAFDDFDCVDACFDQWDQSTPDPSACQQNGAVTCDGPGPGPGPGPGICVGEWDGAYCDVDSDCSSYNCFDNKCYANDPGNPCDVDSDCSTYNCFESCCYGNGAGEPCDVDSDCSSYNCYNNVCQ